MANFTLFTLLTLFWRNNSKKKSVYSYTKNWYTSIFESLTSIQFFEYFRMSKNKFEGIFQVLYLDTTNISKKDFKRNLFYLSFIYRSLECLTSIRELFGIPLATTFRIIEKTSNFINSVSIKYIRLPGLNEFNILEAGFRSLADFPGTILAIDGTHIPITALSVSQNLYYNRKKFFPLNVLALVDHEKKKIYHHWLWFKS